MRRARYRQCTRRHHSRYVQRSTKRTRREIGRKVCLRATRGKAHWMLSAGCTTGTSGRHSRAMGGSARRLNRRLQRRRAALHAPPPGAQFMLPQKAGASAVQLNLIETEFLSSPLCVRPESSMQSNALDNQSKLSPGGSASNAPETAQRAAAVLAGTAGLALPRCRPNLLREPKNSEYMLPVSCAAWAARQYSGHAVCGMGCQNLILAGIACYAICRGDNTIACEAAALHANTCATVSKIQSLRSKKRKAHGCNRHGMRQ